ncbi:MAG: DUF475 domain-containing protein [Candidatus Adlerbacteria bacterium]|nr:DUF475 domain-containing protein [Candidatus Adlerbacteria bacterium]
MKLFIAPIVISIIALLAVWMWGGWAAFLLACLLSVLEVTLSFDNAVVNAKVLAQMSEKWQRRFLTWGILLAVFGTRLILPAIIVSIAALVSPVTAAVLAFENPEEYSRLLSGATPLIGAFGGAFLLMVSLKYFFDVGKSVHWISIIETRLARWGRIEAIELALALTTLLILSYLTHAPQGPVLAAGCIGILLFIVIQGIASSLRVDNGHAASALTRTGIILFIYLNILDAAFSLDGVIGAFALTTVIPIIFVGLGVGAYFVRSITVYLVRKKTLETLKYLEHGAHWAILGLALSMLAGLVVHIPEAVIGLIGLVFVSLAYVSSRREMLRRA